jgi:hypothetical protein
MIDFAPRTDAGLPELLAARARNASDVRLALDVAGGLLAAAVLLVWRPPAWPVSLSAALCFAAFGAWGIAERELHDERLDAGGRDARVLRALRSLATAVGTLAAFVLFFGALGLALGTIIS